MMVHYTHCPICGGSLFSKLLEAKDFTVSGERFTIFQCNECTGAFTQDVPGQSEIGPYYQSETYVSHSNTKKGLVNRIYHAVRSRTLQNKRKLVEEFTGLKKGMLLDVGCGTGAFLNEMKLNGWEVKGLEPDEGARAKAKELFGIVASTPENLFELAPAQFDAITLWHVLEHVHDLQAYAKAFYKLLKPSGKLFIAVPNYTSGDAAHYQDYWAAYDVPRHLYHFSPKSMQVFMSKHQLSVIAKRPMWYDSFYVSMLSEQYKNGRQNLIGAALAGFRSNVGAFRNVEKCSSVIYIIEKGCV